MSIRLWRQLFAREAGKPVTGLMTSVMTESLERRLREWIESAIFLDDQERLALRLDIPEAFEDAEYLYQDDLIDSSDLYDVIDAILNLNSPAYLQAELQQILDDSLSAYCISPDGRSLQNRSDRTEKSALNDSSADAEAREDVGSAADHLAAAWDKAYATTPDYAKSYSEAIKAVEAAAHALIEPNNAKATLGTMLGQLRSHPGKFCLMLPAPGVDIAPVIGMMAALWEGQTSRHGGKNPTRPETGQEARAAVHLAVALVHWLSSGTVGRRQPPQRPPIEAQTQETPQV
jgi:hypothetical protein